MEDAVQLLHHVDTVCVSYIPKNLIKAYSLYLCPPVMVTRIKPAYGFVFHGANQTAVVSKERCRGVLAILK